MALCLIVGLGESASARWYSPRVVSLRVFAHCVDETPRAATPLTVKHVWTEGDAPNEHSEILTDAKSYSITAGADLVNVSIELAVPSVRE